MKIYNTTDFTDWFLRRMVAWICHHKSIKYSTRKIHTARFHNSQSSYSGWAYRSERVFWARIGWPELYPVYQDRVHDLVAVTAHEIGHLTQDKEVFDSKYCERDAEQRAIEVVRDFDEQGAELIEQWDELPWYLKRKLGVYND
jgi:hypothetical protein